MLHIAFEWLQPLLTVVLQAGLLAIFAVIGRYIPIFARLYRDEKNRAAMHSAIDTGVDLALATTEAGARAIPGVQAIDTALSYVERSVPGALKHFFADNANKARDHLRDMILAKIEAKALAADDPLVEALRGAGAPVGGAA